MPFPAKRAADGAAPARPKAPPKITNSGSLVGFDKAYDEITSADGARKVRLTIHVRRPGKQGGKGLAAVVRRALARPDRVVKLLGGDIKILVEDVAT
jgi:hypothetical protein